MKRPKPWKRIIKEILDEIAYSDLGTESIDSDKEDCNIMVPMCYAKRALLTAMREGINLTDGATQEDIDTIIDLTIKMGRW